MGGGGESSNEALKVILYFTPPTPATNSFRHMPSSNSILKYTLILCTYFSKLFSKQTLESLILYCRMKYVSMRWTWNYLLYFYILHIVWIWFHDSAHNAQRTPINMTEKQTGKKNGEIEPNSKRKWEMRYSNRSADGIYSVAGVISVLNDGDPQKKKICKLDCELSHAENSIDEIIRVQSTYG